MVAGHREVRLRPRSSRCQRPVQMTRSTRSFLGEWLRAHVQPLDSKSEHGPSPTHGASHAPTSRVRPRVMKAGLLTLRKALLVSAAHVKQHRA